MNQHLSLANRLHEVVIGNLTCVNTWGVYLFDADFDGEPELRENRDRFISAREIHNVFMCAFRLRWRVTWQGLVL